MTTNSGTFLLSSPSLFGVGLRSEHELLGIAAPRRRSPRRGGLGGGACNRARRSITSRGVDARNRPPAPGGRVECAVLVRVCGATFSPGGRGSAGDRGCARGGRSVTYVTLSGSGKTARRVGGDPRGSRSRGDPGAAARDAADASQAHAPAHRVCGGHARSSPRAFRRRRLETRWLWRSPLTR
jgi:hypothetical protein